MVLTLSVGENTEITSTWETESNEVATQTSVTHCPSELVPTEIGDLEGLLIPGEVDSIWSEGELSGVKGTLVTLATAQ